MARSGWVALSIVVVGASVVSALFGPAGDEFRINAVQTNTSNLVPAACARPDGSYAVAWQGIEDGAYDIRGLRLASDGAPLGAEFQVNTYTTGYQGFGAMCCTPDGGFIVVWTSQGQDGSSDGIYAQRYDLNATRVGDEFQVNTYTTGDQIRPRISCAPNGGYAIVWQDGGRDGSGQAVVARTFASTGDALGPDFVLNTYTTSNQRAPSVGARGDDFVAVWQDSGQDGDSAGIFGRTVTSAGAPAGTEFQVNAYTTGTQIVPYVAGDPSGAFTVVWADNPSSDVMARRYDSSGNPTGSEFRVNTYTTGIDTQPAISVDWTGVSVVVWQNLDGADGDTWGVFGTRFDTAGLPMGTQFQVNTYTLGGQGSAYFPSAVAADPDGDFLVVWTGETSGTLGSDVVGRVFRDSCGDGVVGAGEACDDGSRLPGDCCDATCQPVARGAACTGDGGGCFACDGAGSCATGAVACPPCQRCDTVAGCVVGPRTDCRRPTRSRRAFLDLANRSKDRKDAFLFSWRKGAATTLGDFGNPAGATDVGVCVFDRAGGVDRLVFNATAPGGGNCRGRACWKARGTKGFRYRDKQATSDGLKAVDLRAGAAGKASVVVRGRGANLGFPRLGLTPPVTAEVDVEGGACFGAAFPSARPNTATRFRAKGD